MSIRTFALLYGIVFLIVGAGGFIPGLLAPPHTHPDLSVNTGFGHLMGLFPVNVLHNIVHLLFGAWGVAAYRGFGVRAPTPKGSRSSTPCSPSRGSFLA